MSSAKTAIDLYINFDQYLIKLKDTITKIEKDVVDPITLFQQQITTIYLESLNDLKAISAVVNEQKKMMEKQKQKYHESCKTVIEKETQLLRFFNKKVPDNEMNQANDALLKVKSIAENNSEQYKYELIKFNKIVEDQEKKYKKTMNVMKSNEESRIFFLKCHFEKFSKIFEEFNTSGFDFVNVSHIHLIN